MHFYGTILTLTVLPASVLALPPRSITARNTGDVSASQNSQALGAVIGDGNCTGMERLSLPCVIPSLIEIRSSKSDAHHHIPLSDPLSIRRRRRRIGKFEFVAVQGRRIK